MFRYGIISFRQAAKLANASKTPTSRIAKFLEEKKIVSIGRIQGCTSGYKFWRKVLKIFIGIVFQKDTPFGRHRFCGKGFTP